MEEFLDTLDSIASKPGIWAFAIYCLGLGIVVVLADLLSYFINLMRQPDDSIPVSYLEMNYGTWSGRIFSILLWSFGSAIIGYIAAMSNMIEISFQGALLVCLTWPILFSRIVKNSKLNVEKEIQ